MLVTGQEMYLLIPNQSNKRVLAEGKVVESTGTTFAIELVEPIALETGTQTLAYAEVRGKFFQQASTLTEARVQLPATVYVFSRDGEPVSAEQRQTFRVSVALSEVFAQIGPKARCQVVDISAEGIAFISDPTFAIGSSVKISLEHEGNRINGDARVQTMKSLPGGKARYGLLIPNTNMAARKTLLKLSMGFQRTQLKRLAGAA